VPLPLRALLAAEAKRSFREQRDADHVAEHRPVAVPAEAGADLIFDQQGMDELVRRQAGEGGGLGAQRQEPVRHLFRFGEARAVESVLHPERDRPPLADEALELERCKRKGSEMRDELRFLLWRNQLRRVGESLRPRRRGRSEHAQLIRRHRSFQRTNHIAG
jgi:hypothetical protein